jgi:hypothetical protein
VHPAQTSGQLIVTTNRSSHRNAVDRPVRLYRYSVFAGILIADRPQIGVGSGHDLHVLVMEGQALRTEADPSVVAEDAARSRFLTSRAFRHARTYEFHTPNSG